MEYVKLLIGDDDVPATGGATFTRLNPITGEPAQTSKRHYPF